MDLDRETFKALKALLLRLPGWATDEARRRAFVTDALYGHPLLTGGGITWTQDGDSAATNLLQACAGSEVTMPDGRTTALCALLGEVRGRGWASGGSLAVLERAVGCGGHRATWRQEPYPGLLAFDRHKAPIFFGRAVETRDLLRRLATPQGKRFLLVTGASGSGKSSLVRAGVWAALEEGGVPDLPGTGDWLISPMFPSAMGGDPFLALASSLLQDAKGRFSFLRTDQEAAALKADPEAFGALLQRVRAELPSAQAEWLLVLDQMEELFTPATEAHAEPFLDLLLAAAERPGFRVIATIRSDFLHRCVDHAGLRAVINADGQYSVGRPGPVAMARMITGPVREVDTGVAMDVEDALVERMVADAEAEPGGLALLAFTLKELYRQCREQGLEVMGLDAYCDPDFDGLTGVIGRHADAVLARADAAAQAALPRVFSRLVTVRRDGTATRRREHRSYWREDVDALRLIDHLSDAGSARAPEQKNRLLVSDAAGPGAAEPTVEVAHEALLREWATLATWIDDAGEALRLREQLEAEAQAWDAAGRPDHLRWRHERLAPARDLLRDAALLGELQADRVAAAFVVPEADWLNAQLDDDGLDHSQREDIGLRLAEVRDPRPGVGVIDGVPDIRWCEVPSGAVEIKGHGLFDVEPFRIAAYPVTHAQFEAFVRASDGCGNDRWWKDLEREDPITGRLRRHGNFPATHVSWFDAMAFCRWLSARLGVEVRLPDEWEWQWTAQSAQSGFVYPWGTDWEDGVANTDEAGIGRSTAVGIYPGGRSTQGVYDLAGNVEEWCRNPYKDPKQVAPGRDESRVLRGGSWRDFRDGARADLRSGYLPFNRLDDVGFRVLCGAPIR
jgi:energy-coupling factor transporter ATP-binding protein EcfA2